MIVDYSPACRADLDGIWQWNANRYGNRHADDYIKFLVAETNTLPISYGKDKTVPL